MALVHAGPAEAVSLMDGTGKPQDTMSSAIVKTAEFQAIHLIVAEGAEIARHAVPGPITLYCLEGHVRLNLDHSQVELHEGHWLYLEGGEPHAVSGLKFSRVLLTIMALPARKPEAAPSLV